MLQLVHPPSHCDRHFNASESILLDAFALWIAEEDDYSVANVFVYRHTVFQRDLGHLGEILVE